MWTLPNIHVGERSNLWLAFASWALCICNSPQVIYNHECVDMVLYSLVTEVSNISMSIVDTYNKCINIWKLWWLPSPHPFSKPYTIHLYMQFFLHTNITGPCGSVVGVIIIWHIEDFVIYKTGYNNPRETWLSPDRIVCYCWDRGLV